MLTTDRELLSATARGDRDAHRQLYERHARWLFLRLRSRCSDHGLVEEVVQDTFVKVWRKAHTYRGQDGVGAWLWSIAIRSLLDRLRKRSPTPFARLPGREHAVLSAEEEVLASIERGPLGPALNQLSPELRAVMQATVIDGLSVREAAQLLGIPAGTVKTRAMRARQLLREALT